MLVELIENVIKAENRKQQEFFELAEQFRSATEPKEAKPSETNWAECLWRRMFPSAHAQNHERENLPPNVRQH
jgi:hypothetical protein